MLLAILLQAITVIIIDVDPATYFLCDVNSKRETMRLLINISLITTVINPIAALI